MNDHDIRARQFRAWIVFLERSVIPLLDLAESFGKRFGAELPWPWDVKTEPLRSTVGKCSGNAFRNLSSVIGMSDAPPSVSWRMPRGTDHW
jgi:hypothetical protein